MARESHDYEQYFAPGDAPITITGRLGRDPEKKTYETRDGEDGVIATYSIASDKYDSKEKKNITIWTDITCFGKQAERDLKNLVKGNMVQVVGELQVNARDDGKVYWRMNPQRVNYLVWGSERGGSSYDDDEDEKPKAKKPDEKKKSSLRPEKSKVAEGADDSDDLFK